MTTNRSGSWIKNTVTSIRLCYMFNKRILSTSKLRVLKLWIKGQLMIINTSNITGTIYVVITGLGK